MRQLIPLLWIVLLASCSPDTLQDEHSNDQGVVYGKGVWQNPDSFEKPVTLPAGPPILTRAGKPSLLPDEYPQPASGQPSVVAAGRPDVCTPGKDTFALPETFAALRKIKHVGIPEVMVVKDPAHKENNPANFSFYKIMQGLKTNSIRCFVEDNFGNLWLGTTGSGLARYDGKSLTYFTKEQGLISNVVTSALKDKNGNLWFGTKDGICWYDGKNFYHLTDQRGLSGKMISSMLEDNNGYMWFGTYQAGLLRFDGSNFTYFTDKQGLVGNLVTSIQQDKEGNLWFSTNRGVSRYDGKSFYNFTEKQGLVHYAVFSSLLDQRGVFWFGTYHGLSCYDGHNFTNYKEEQGFNSNVVTHILQDARGVVWFGTHGGGVSRFDGKSFTTFTEADGLADNVVWRIFDNKDNLWLATEGGLCRYDGQRFINVSDKENQANDVSAFLQDNRGEIWWSTNGNGVSRYDGKNFSHFTETQGLPENKVSCMLKDQQGLIWFGTFGGGLSRFDGKNFMTFTQAQGLVDNFISCLLQDRSGCFWFGSYGYGVTRFDGKRFTRFTTRQGLPSNEITNVLEDSGGNLWFGTYDRGIARYDGKSFTNFTEADGLASNEVLSLMQDKSGNLWIGTQSGVSRYDGKCFVSFNDKDGLGSNAVVSLLQDADGNIWLGTRKGLSKINRSHLGRLSACLAQEGSPLHSKRTDNLDSIRQGFFYSYDHNDGFLGVNCRRNAVFQDSARRIWWGADVLSYFTPEGGGHDTLTPTVQLNSVKLFGEEIPWANMGAVTCDSSGHETVNGTSRDTLLDNGVLLHDIRFDGIAPWYPLPLHLSLPYNNNNLTFAFIGAHMQSCHHIKYQYQLEGLENNWSVKSERSETQYGNLPPGKYTFKVKAMNRSGLWSKPFAFSFEVRPPWWKTWWFKASLLFTIVVSVWVYIRSLEIKIAEATLEIKERHKEIMDSISYAERIQRSFLATQQHLDSNLGEYFILFKPKEVVSGDFYWSATLNNGNFAMVCADSTGHGVPGAIMSLLNVTSLEKAIEIETEPHRILDATRKIIIERLNRDGSAEGGKDGMDGSLLSFDFKNDLLYCAASNNPLCIIRGHEVIELKPDHIPIGKHERDHEPFTLRTLQLQKGDAVYMLTDGFADQFGGPEGKKFKYKKLLRLLLSLAHAPMAVQKQQLNAVFEEWKGNLEQVDDVTIIGVRI